MSNYPAKFLPFYLVAALLFISIPGFCSQSGLTEVQKEAIIYREKGWQLQQENRLEEALSCYQKAIILDPTYAVAYNDAGIVLESLGQPEKAKEMYLKSIEVAPDYPNTYSNLALFYEEQKDYTNALLCWIKRLTLGSASDPWTDVAQKRIADIARLCPEAYEGIGQEYAENIPDLEINEPSGHLNLILTEEPDTVSLMEEKEISKPDNKARAQEYLNNAKRSFSRGQYVAALKEATVAEYLDSSNEEISAFVAQIRNKILK